MYFKGPIWSTKVHKVLQREKKKLVYFSGSLNIKILVLKDKKFLFSDPLKSTSFFFLTLQNLVYFSGPNWSLKVHQMSKFCFLCTSAKISQLQQSEKTNLLQLSCNIYRFFLNFIDINRFQLSLINEMEHNRFTNRHV